MILGSWMSGIVRLLRTARRKSVTHRLGNFCGRRSSRVRSVGAFPEALESRLLLTVQFVFDYSSDSNGFFGTAERQVLEVAAQQLTDSLQDTLTEIVPQKFSLSDTWTVDYEDP